jgi:hypothetical protein
MQAANRRYVVVCLLYRSWDGKRPHTLRHGPRGVDDAGGPLLDTQLSIQPLGEGAKVGTCLTESRIFLEQLVNRLAAMLVCVT